MLLVFPFSGVRIATIGRNVEGVNLPNVVDLVAVVINQGGNVCLADDLAECFQGRG